MGGVYGLGCCCLILPSYVYEPLTYLKDGREQLRSELNGRNELQMSVNDDEPLSRGCSRAATGTLQVLDKA